MTEDVGGRGAGRGATEDENEVASDFGNFSKALPEDVTGSHPDGRMYGGGGIVIERSKEARNRASSSLRRRSWFGAKRSLVGGPNNEEAPEVGVTGAPNTVVTCEAEMVGTTAGGSGGGGRGAPGTGTSGGVNIERG